MWRRANAPVDAVGLAVLRVLVGAILAWDALRYLYRGRDAHAFGWVERYYIDPPFTLQYVPWVRPLDGLGMVAVYWVLVAAALAVAAGALYRVAALVYALVFTYVFLCGQGHYMNHHYLVCLLAWQLALLPANRCLAVDAWRGAVPTREVVPAWTVWVLRAQIGLVYFFGGVAKLGWDWLAGRPLDNWLLAERGHPVFGALIAQFGATGAGQLVAWSGLAFDLCVPFALLWRPTRAAALACAGLFHAANASLFAIGIFPYLSFALTLAFLDPSWPRALLPGRDADSQAAAPDDAPPPGRLTRLGAAGLLALYAVQLWLPLRHWVLASDNYFSPFATTRTPHRAARRCGLTPP